MSPNAFRKEGLRGGFRLPMNAMKTDEAATKKPTD